MPPDLSENVLRVVLVDDHSIVVDGLTAVFASAPGFDVVGTGGDAKSGMDLAEQHLPDAMLLDLNMPGGGLAAIEHIHAEFPAIALIVLTARDDADAVFAAMRLGARGYVLKGIGGSELVDVVRLVCSGQPYITPTLAGRLLIEARVPAQTAKEPSGTAVKTMPTRLQLTVREEQILRLVAEGRSNKQIASDLELSESTIKHYMTNLMQKMQVKNRVAAALLAQKSQRNA